MSPVWPPRFGSRASGRSLLDDLRDGCDVERLDVGRVRHGGVGHDGGRVGVDEDDLVAELSEGLARLRSGVVELAGLADDDRAGTDDQDLVDVGALRHSVSLDAEPTSDTSSSRRIGPVALRAEAAEVVAAASQTIRREEAPSVHPVHSQVLHPFVVGVVVEDVVTRLAGQDPEVVEGVTGGGGHGVVPAGQLDQAVVPDDEGLVQLLLGAVHALESEALGRG